MEIDVKGHSGCSIKIKQDERGLFIQKSTYDKGYLKRLALQADKQVAARRKDYKYIKIPKIFNLEKTNVATIINMEYIYSRNFMEYFEEAGFNQLHHFINVLCLFIETEITSSKYETRNAESFLQKWASVESSIKNNSAIAYERIGTLLEHTKAIFSELTDISIPYGICHGDLTFSNILFNNNCFYLIDFLDSFIESPLIDIVKIRQDTNFLWSLLMYSKPYDRIRIKTIFQKIDMQIHKYFCKYGWYKKYYTPFQIMNLFRVLQYAKEDKVINHLINNLEVIINEC